MNTTRRHEINEFRGKTLLPALWQDLEPVLLALEHDGFFPMITQAYRSNEEQTALYAQGREELTEVNSLRKAAGLDPIQKSENKKVTNAKAGQSLHNSHRAVDLVNYPDDSSPLWDDMDFFKQVNVYLEPLGWLWGGNFKGSFKDFPHYEK